MQTESIEISPGFKALLQMLLEEAVQEDLENLGNQKGVVTCQEPVN